MKKLCVCARAALSFTACVNEDGLLSESKGYINLNVNTDNEMVVTRAEQKVTDLSNWKITIKKGGNTVADWSETQGYAAGEDYSAEVYNYVDDNAAIAANDGWGDARYSGVTESNFKVEAGKSTTVNINCGTAKNTKVTATFADGFTSLVTNYNITLTGRNLTFDGTNASSKSAYYAANTTVNYTLTYTYKGTEKKIENCSLNTGNAGTATNILVNANDNGTIALNITYDDAWTTGTEQSITIDAATGAEVTE